MRPEDVDGIVFDLYGTLLDVDSLEASVRAIVGAAAGLVSLWRAKQLEYAFIRALTGDYVDFWTITGDALDHACARLGRVLAPGDRERLLDAWNQLAPFPDARPSLDALGAGGARPLAILSNGSPAMLEAALRASGLRDRFRAVLSADLVQRFKPDPAVYALAPGHLGIPARRLLFVTANGFDVAGAGRFGLRVARVDRAGTPLDRLGVVPDVTVRSLEELARWS